jgi:hypothetical protein
LWVLEMDMVNIALPLAIRLRSRIYPLCVAPLPFPRLGLSAHLRLAFPLPPPVFVRPKKVCWISVPPAPRLMPGWLGAGWPWLVLARHKSEHRRAAPPRPQRTWAGAASLLLSSWFWFPNLLSAAALLGSAPVFPTCQRPATGRDGDSEWVGVAEARQTEGVGAWSVLPSPSPPSRALFFRLV